MSATLALSDPDEFDDPESADAPSQSLPAIPPRLTVPVELAGERLDKALARMLPSVSRSRIRQWIDAGAVRLNEAQAVPRASVAGGDAIELAPAPSPRDVAARPEPMTLDLVHADESIIVLDKPPGLVVHPGAGNWSGTLLNGLLALDPELARLPRAGIVHRLDAGTSGLLVVARNEAAQTHLVRQLQARTVTREYWAVVHGTAPPEGVVEAPIDRDPRNPLRFRVVRAPRGKPARTLFRRIEAGSWQGRTVAWLGCRLETGRTHQIRVHLESIGLPLWGDPVYRRGQPATPAGVASLPRLERQALHACRLVFVHPRTGATVQWFRPPPADMRALMTALGLHVDRRVPGFAT